MSIYIDTLHSAAYTIVGLQDVYKRHSYYVYLRIFEIAKICFAITTSIGWVSNENRH